MKESDKCPNPKCGREWQRLIATDKGIGCNHCFQVTNRGFDAIIGRVRFNKWGIKMTEADANHIKTNKKRADGQYRPDRRWL